MFCSHSLFVSCVLSLRHLFLPSFLFFCYSLACPTSPPCRAFSLPLIILARLSFCLSHLHFSSLSNELKSSHILFFHLLHTSFLPLSVFFQSARTPLTYLPHFSCEIKTSFLVCNHNAIAPLSHPLCASIAATLRTACIQRDFKRF